MSSKRLTRVSTPRPLRGPMHRVVSGSLSPGRPQPFTKSARLPIWVFSQSFKPRSSRARWLVRRIRPASSVMTTALSIRSTSRSFSLF